LPSPLPTLLPSPNTVSNCRLCCRIQLPSPPWQSDSLDNNIDSEGWFGSTKIEKQIENQYPPEPLGAAIRIVPSKNEIIIVDVVIAVTIVLLRSSSLLMS
jgi:hypothetical protein